ncbi:MAG TPA: hypothetical protein ENJ41_06550, partial [Oceanospirillales bacterium]|nr:hypothetical protein [Oceanospirillales bacterium]
MIPNYRLNILVMTIHSITCKINRLALTAVLLCAASFASAGKHDGQIREAISAIGDRSAATEGAGTNSTPNSFVALDFSIHNAESWDAKDQPKNIVTNCINGDVITGFEYNNVTIQTAANSYFSEAVIYFSDSNVGDDGIRLTIGFGNETSGTAVFNSDGILDISDSGNEDVLSLADKKFFMQFYEKIDDSPNVVDARFTNGVLKVWGQNLIANSGCPFIEGSTPPPPVSADLSVDLSLNDDDGVYLLGDTLEYALTVSNNGDATATNVSIENNLSYEARFVAMSCDDGTSIEAVEQYSSVNVQNIAANSTLSCTIEAVISAFGGISNSVTVSAANDDDSSNNAVVLEINGAVRAIPAN